MDALPAAGCQGPCSLWAMPVSPVLHLRHHQSPTSCFQVEALRRGEHTQTERTFMTGFWASSVGLNFDNAVQNTKLPGNI